MERRYRLMAALGVRNVGGFNRKVKDAEKNGRQSKTPCGSRLICCEDDEEQEAPNLETLPFIVVVIDEFADMMIVGKKVEQLIARIAQKDPSGRHPPCVGHSALTSVDVITGLIKANVPTRIAFQVSSKVIRARFSIKAVQNSCWGTVALLYLPAGSPLPIRVHGAFVDDDEVHRVVDSWKLGEPNYLEVYWKVAQITNCCPERLGQLAAQMMARATNKTRSMTKLLHSSLSRVAPPYHRCNAGRELVTTVLPEDDRSHGASRCGEPHEL